MPSHDHEALYQAHDWQAGHGSFDSLPMVLGNALISNTTKWNTKTTGGGGSHSHSISGYSSTTGNTGSDSSFSIVQSYYTVYIWTRTV